MTNPIVDPARVDLLLQVVRLTRHPDAVPVLAAALAALEHSLPSPPPADVDTERYTEIAVRTRLPETDPAAWAAFEERFRRDAEAAVKSWNALDLRLGRAEDDLR